MRGLSWEWKQKKWEKKQIDDDPGRSIYNRGATEMLYHVLCTFDVWSPTVYAGFGEKRQKQELITPRLAVCWKRFAGNSRDNGDRIKRAFDRPFQDGSTGPIIGVPRV